MKRVFACVVSVSLLLTADPWGVLAAEPIPPSQLRAESAAIQKALGLCRAGNLEEASDSIFTDLQHLPRGYRAAELAVRFARQQKNGSQRITEMELWTIPVESTEVGLPSAWLQVRAQLLPADSNDQAQALLMHVLTRTDQVLPGVVQELATRTPFENDDQIVQRLQKAGVSNTNVGLLDVLLAERRNEPSLALTLLEPVRRRAPDDPSLNLARARLLARLDRVRESLDVAQAVTLQLKETGPTDLFAQALFVYGEGLVASGSPSEASAAYGLGEQAATEICDAELALRLRLKQGQVLLESGRYSEAETVFQAGVKSDPDSPDAQTALALLLVEVGEPVEALIHFERSASLLTKLGRPAVLGELRREWAGALASLGRQPEALRILQQALEEAATQNDRSLACRLSVQAAHVWLGLRHPQTSLKLLGLAADLAHRESSDRLLAEVACADAEAHLVAGSPEKAVAEAATCRSRAVASREPSLSTSGRLLGARALTELGRPTESLTLLAEERSTTAPTTVEGRTNLAQFLLERGRAEAKSPTLLKAAAKDLETAARMAEGLGRLDLAWRARQELARVARAENRPQDAVAELDRAIDSLERSRSDLNAPGSVPDRSASRLMPYAEALRLAIPNPGALTGAVANKAWELADRRAGRRLRDRLARPQDAAANDEERRLLDLEAARARAWFWAKAALAAPELDPRLRFQVARWIANSGLPQATLTELRAANSAQSSGALRAFLESIESRLAEEHRAAVGQLAAKNQQLASLIAPRLAAVSQMQRVLAADEAILNYVPSPEGIELLLMTRQGLWASRLPAWAQLEAAWKNYRNQLVNPPRSGQTFDPKDGQSLLKQLVETPLGQAGLKNLPLRLSLLADGSLLEIPFGALPRADGRFVLEQCSVAWLPAAWWRTVQDSGGAASQRLGRGLLFGSPFLPSPEEAPPIVIDQVSIDSELFTISGFPADRNPQNPSSSAIETQAVAALLPSDSKMLLEGDALETALTEPGMDRWELLHFAVPAFSDPAHEERMGIALARREGEGADGFVDWTELVRLRLGSKLVTLTGSVSASPGGILDLAGAFLYAGSETTVATLWQAGEESSVYLMEKLYSKLAGSRPGAALREAQLALMRGEVQDKKGRTLKKLSHPHYWAGYQLIGWP